MQPISTSLMQNSKYNKNLHLTQGAHNKAESRAASLGVEAERNLNLLQIGKKKNMPGKANTSP